MNTEVDPAPDIDDDTDAGAAAPSLRRAMAGLAFGAAAVIVTLFALVAWPPASALAAPGALLVAAAALALVAVKLIERRRRPLALTPLVAIALAGAGAIATAWWWTLPGSALDTVHAALLALAVCVAVGVGRRRLGAALALAGTALALAPPLARLLDGRAELAGATPWLPPATLQHLLLIGAGAAAGWLVGRAMQRQVARAVEGEQRFRGLLSLAVYAYWEIDADLRLVRLIRHGDAPCDALGRIAWELPGLRIDAETLDLLQADLEQRVAFRELPVQWQPAGRRAAHLRLSGEPLFDDRGVFTGYRGVARDVSSDIEVRQALLATESRYQDLFSLIPTPLVLHRGGRVLDANPAALALFDFDSVESMIGHDLLAQIEDGDSRERARRRLETLADLPVGDALPVTELRLRSRRGRLLVVRACAVRATLEDETATLSIFVDDTERRAVEDAVRRSESLLSHLVATSPDVITLTDLASGRYAMVNRTFERLAGYDAAEVVGRTSLEIGIWLQPADRERFLEQVREHGSVQDFPARFRTKSGDIVSMLVSGARFSMDRREFLVINARDVTGAERERLEREAILQNASVGIAFTRDGRFVQTNPRFDRMFGWDAGELIGQPVDVVWDGAGGATPPDISADGDDAAAFERQAVRRDGSGFLARVAHKAIDRSHPSRGGTIWIVDDVTERHEFEAMLARTRDAAEAASRAKSSFLANTSHELRTPLNALLGLARLAGVPDIDPDRRQRYLDQIVDSAQGLAAIISDILDLSKIEAGRMDIEAVPFDAAELMRLQHLTHAPVAQARALALTLQIDPEAAGTVVGDPLRVRQIVGNYVSNALKFTRHGSVRMRLRRTDAQHLRFEVEDTGPGIDDDMQERLFTPFTQADESTTRRFGGTGLGLSICRQLATLMGGTVGVQSRLGHGSCFWVELPLPAAAAPAATPGAPAGPDLEGAVVLLVEDNAVNMMIAVALLQEWGVVVEEARDGQEAVELLQQLEAEGRRIDAVLMDLQMPVMGGLEATRRLRADHDERRLPILALTAAALVSEREQALAAGMNDFITKPIDPDLLRARLAFWIAGRDSA